MFCHQIMKFKIDTCNINIAEESNPPFVSQLLLTTYPLSLSHLHCDVKRTLEKPSPAHPNLHNVLSGGLSPLFS